MISWPALRVDEVADVNPTTRLAKGEEHPYVPMDAVTPGLRFVRASQVRSLKGGARFLGGDTLLARITPCLENGKVAQYDPEGAPAFGSTEFIVLRAKKDITHPDFLFYVVRSSSIIKPAISSMSGASGRQRANTDVIAATEIPWPLIKTQLRIAEILGVYDELIEINRQRMVLLEKVTLALFEEWFFRFRVPEREAVLAMISSEPEPPESWPIQPVGKIIDFDPHTKVPVEGEKPFVPMAYLPTSGSFIHQHEWRTGNAGTKFRNGDTLFARITPCLENGKTGLVRDLPGPGIGFGSTEFIVLRAAIAGAAFAYCLARSDDFRRHAEQGMSGASGRQRARTDVVASYAMPCPPLGSDLYARFENAAWPMLELVGKLGEANRSLAAARDLLLPRLISGELSVAEAEQELAQAA